MLRKNQSTLDLAFKQRALSSTEWEWKNYVFSAKAQNMKEHNMP